MSKADDGDNYDMIDDEIEYILKRPLQWVGDIEHNDAKMWIFDEDSDRFILKEISYVPAFYKIFDEVLVNARDHVTRCVEHDWEKCTIIKVDISDEGVITVWNNGAGIPIVMKKKHNMLVPTMIFGHLRSSSNYDDTQKRRVGGMNGLGVKLTNIYSEYLKVETVDAERGLKFFQHFSRNMYDREEAVITKDKRKPYTSVSFKPDLSKFSMGNMSDDVKALFKKRVFDIALTPGIKVFFNGELIKANNFPKYIDLYFPDGTDYKKVIDISNNDWKVAVIYDPTDTLEHQSVSFVNGICTYRNGSHVEYVSNQIVRKIQASVAAKVKGLTVKPGMIKENLVFFIDSCIENPSFDTQTKEFLTSKVAKYGTKYEAPELFLNKIVKIGVVEQIALRAKAQSDVCLEKATKVGNKLGFIKKLTDAHDADARDGECTLILTEGDSAKTLAMSGLSVVGHEKFGVFPLKGKLLNVRDASPKSILENAEIQNIIKIVGLVPGKKYTSVAGLRYSRISVFADQDLDGFHIKGLIMNMVHHFWPSLIKTLPFICTLATPIVKATKKRVVESFYDLNDFKKWEQTAGTGWTIKYYKGLGTSTPAEAKEYFKDFVNKLITYKWTPVQKGEKDLTEAAMTKAFDKKKADERKDWIRELDPTNSLDYNKREVPIIDFIDTELRAFAAYDAQRSIPNMMDGLKIGQRKVMFSAFKKNLKTEIKVAQFQGYISEQANYHHGEKSLEGTIVNLAQDYVGSNNINLLMPCGQFGSRLQGGKDSASARYIFTRLNEITDHIFRPIDREIVIQQEEEGMKIEPEFYAPVVPMILVNGAEGIGTGFSTTIAPSDPKLIIANLRRVIEGRTPRSMPPYYRHFTGEIEKIDDSKYVTRARYEIKGDVITINDLPIGTWSQPYQEAMEDMVRDCQGPKSPHAGKIGSDIKEMRFSNNDTTVHTVITFKKGTLQKYIDNNTLEQGLKLTSNVNLTNMYLWNEKNKLKKYATYSEILSDFARVRVKLYQKRKEYQLDRLGKDLIKDSAKLRYVKAVIADPNTIFKKNNKEMVVYLEENEYPMMGEKKNSEKVSYQYLLDILLRKCNKEEVAKLRAKINAIKAEIKELKAKTAEDLWWEDLDVFEEAYDIWKKKDDEAYAELQSNPVAASGAKPKRRRVVKK